MNERRPLRVLFAIAEAYPFAKVGGLGDVGAALPAALAERGHDVRLVLPSYPSVGPGVPVAALDVSMGRRSEQVAVSDHGTHRGVRVYSVGNDRFDRPVPYGYEDDDVVPFVLWSKALVDLTARWAWRPDVVHVNEWHAALVPQYLRRGPHRAALSAAGTLLTIHNLAHQGRVSAATRALLGLGGKGCLLARGITFADVVNTVSRRHRDEILTPAGGFGLDRLLRSRSDALHGILNGVDYAEFDPARDPHIRARYDGGSVSGKQPNKAELQRLSALPADPDRTVLGVVSRLVDQKGISVLVDGVDRIVGAGAQVVVVGVGDPRHEAAVQAAAARHPDAVAYHRGDAESVARAVYAGADMLLVPSAYEPCGLTPLIALRYGTVPVVRRTGGLGETVVDCREHPDTGTGLVFDDLSADALVHAVRAGLLLRRDPGRWAAVQRRGMASDFSWRRPATEYVELYRQAVTSRTSVGARRRVARRRPARSAGAVALALVHHANQYVITDGYGDREGLGELLDGYAAVLALHERHGVVANLHVSGTLLQAIAWHRPDFLALVRHLRRRGLLSLVGGTYAENVMPLFPAGFNRRQLERLLWLYERHLGCPPRDVRVAWVPERVWDTARLAPVFTARHLPNGGYRAVLLDDRLLYSGGERAAFDATLHADISAAGHPSTSRAGQWRDACRAHRVAGSEGLLVLPISTELRYWLPPVLPEHWSYLADHVGALSGGGDVDGSLLVYADDLEKTAGVGPWDTRELRQYEELLKWVRDNDDVRAVGLDAWVATHRAPAAEVSLAPGTFLELAGDGHAGEDYRGWAEAPAWLPLRRQYARARVAVDAARAAPADPRLLELAEDHLLASAYETAWHDTVTDEPAPAPWARAVASHSRASTVIADAARWFARADRTCGAAVLDIDDDGQDEVILRNERLYAVLSPGHGARLVYLFAHGTRGGALVVGNPTDDWNWQEELNRYMDLPPNHPGALTDIGGEHAGYEVTGLRDGLASVEMTCVRGPSALLGLRKSVLLRPGAAALVVAYRLPAATPSLDVEALLSPDYLRLLRHGRAGLEAIDGGRWRGQRNGRFAVWLALADGTKTAWVEPQRPGAAHGVMVQLHAATDRFALLVGTGSPSERGCDRLLTAGTAALPAAHPEGGLRHVRGGRHRWPGIHRFPPGGCLPGGRP